MQDDLPAIGRPAAAGSDPATERHAQTFPRLDSGQMARVEGCGRRRITRAGEVLFDPGDRNPPFFVVVSGTVEIVHLGEAEQIVTVHGEREFTGELNSITGRSILVRGRVGEAGELIEVPPEGLRRLIQTDAELSEILMRAFILRRVSLIARGWGGLVLVGSRHHAASLNLKQFLIRNGQPHRTVDVDSDPGVDELLDRFQVRPGDSPILICCGTEVLKNPSLQQTAEALGITPEVNPCTVHDVVIVGAGPAGLATAVYAASEGLDVLVVEGQAPGGQAGTSSKIENYLGFPTGISGAALAGRAFTQAQKFGAEVAVARTAVELRVDRRPFVVVLDDGGTVRARAVVIATGARYRRLPLPELSRFEGAGVYYCATPMEAKLCQGAEVAVVGGGNSAGQGAMFLAGSVKHVHVLVRGDGLADTMSSYLIRRIEESRSVTLHTRTEVVGLEGEGRLQRMRWRDRAGEVVTKDISYLFLMTGAEPSTAWLEGAVLLDDKGFVRTGSDLLPDELAAAGWTLSRRPELLETSRPGVFAVGDVRSGSVKRVASSVGEGSISVHLIHRFLAE